MKIAITGHRPNKLGNDYNLTSPLIMAIKAKILDIITPYGKPTLISGMALGIDTLFAQIAIEQDMPLIAAIPFVGQQSAWPISSQLRWQKIIDTPGVQIKIITSGGYSAQKMQIRNEWMVDNSDILIAVWDGTSGGTKNCVMYAKSKDKFIIHIDPKALILK